MTTAAPLPLMFSPIGGEASTVAAHSWHGTAYTTTGPFEANNVSSPFDSFSISIYFKIGDLPDNDTVLCSVYGVYQPSGNNNPSWATAYVDSDGYVWVNCYWITDFHELPFSGYGGAATFKVNPSMGVITPGQWYWLSVSTYSDTSEYGGDLPTLYGGWCAWLYYMPTLATDGRQITDHGFNPDYDESGTYPIDISVGHNLAPSVTGMYDFPASSGWYASKATLYTASTDSSAIYHSLRVPPWTDPGASDALPGMWFVGLGEYIGATTQLANDNTNPSYSSIDLPSGGSLSLTTPNPYVHGSWTGQAKTSGAPFNHTPTTGGGAEYVGAGVPIFFLRSYLPTSEEVLLSIYCASSSPSSHVVYAVVYLDSSGNVYMKAQNPSESSASPYTVHLNPSMGAVALNEWYFVSLSTAVASAGEETELYQTFTAALTKQSGSVTDGFQLGGLTDNVEQETFNYDVGVGTDISGATGYSDWPDAIGNEMSRCYVKTAIDQAGTGGATGYYVASDTIFNVDPGPDATYHLAEWLTAGQFPGTATQINDNNLPYTSHPLAAGTSLTVRAPSPY